MIKVFGKNENSFSNNGDAVLRPLKAKIHKEDNNEFYLNLECDIEYSDYLVNGNIITANLPNGDQAFRITNPIVKKNKITTKARHVFFDSKNRVVEDVSIENETCNVALQSVNNSAFPASQFNVSSDIEDSKTIEFLHISLYDSIQKILNEYGGHLVRDNFNIKVKTSIGTDNGLTIRYKKNLKDITCEENWDDVCTIVYPIGKDNLTLPEKYVCSTIQYDIPYCKVVTFNQTVSEEDYKDENDNLQEEEYRAALIDDLRNQAENYVSKNSIPKVNYKIKAFLDNDLDIGDVISVIDERIGVDILTNVISFDYDCILKKFTNVEFGNFMPKISNLLQSVSNDAKDAVNGEITNAIDSVNRKIDSIVPETGSVGQVLTKTAYGSTWESLPIYDGSVS